MSIILEDLPSKDTLSIEGSSVRRVSVAGCPVDCISFREVLLHLHARIARKLRTHIVFINAAKVVHYHEDIELRRAIERADFLLADGVPIVWASALSRNALPGRVNGTDLMDRMLFESAERGYRIFLLGARQEVLERCVSEIQRLHPNINIVGYRNGYFSVADEGGVVKEINSSRADILFVGMPTPRKEIWGERNLDLLDIAICQGVGGSFDVLAGLVKRAPGWMQRCGLEWLFRLLQEPRRLWRRYLKTNAEFIWLVFSDFIAFRKSHWKSNEQGRITRNSDTAD